MNGLRRVLLLLLVVFAGQSALAAEGEKVENGVSARAKNRHKAGPPPVPVSSVAIPPAAQKLEPARVGVPEETDSMLRRVEEILSSLGARRKVLLRLSDRARKREDFFLVECLRPKLKASGAMQDSAQLRVDELHIQKRWATDQRRGSSQKKHPGGAPRRWIRSETRPEALAWFQRVDARSQLIHREGLACAGMTDAQGVTTQVEVDSGDGEGGGGGEGGSGGGGGGSGGGTGPAGGPAVPPVSSSF